MLFDDRNQPVDYRFLEINLAFEKQTGLEHALGKTARELKPDLEAHWFEVYGKVALTGEPVHFESRAETLNRWFEVYAFRTGEPQQHMVSILFKDISERKLSEQALLASEARTRTILESITDGFFALDQDWRFTYVNPQAERLLNRTSGALVGQPLLEVYPGFVGSEFEKAYSRTMREQVATSFTAYYPDHDRWYEVHAYPTVEGITVYFRNVTVRMRAQEALRESEQRFRYMADHAPVKIWITDRDGLCTFLSQSWYEVTGQTLETGLGLGWIDAVHPDDQGTTPMICLSPPIAIRKPSGWSIACIPEREIIVG